MEAIQHDLAASLLQDWHLNQAERRSHSITTEQLCLRSQVCQFNNATCGVFQALTQRGYLTATVQNTGAVASGYYVEVSPLHGAAGWPAVPAFHTC